MKKKLLAFIACIALLMQPFSIVHASESFNENEDISSNTIENTIVDNTSLTWNDNKNIPGDVYILRDSTLTIYGNVSVEGNIYVFGTVEIYGSLTVSDTLNCLNCKIGGIFMSAGNYNYGYVYTYGRLKTLNMNVNDSFLGISIPETDPDESCENGHSWQEELTKEPTCTETGIMTYTCSRCNKTETKVIYPLGHTWNSDYTIDKEASYFEEGIKSIHCNICDVVQPGSEVIIPIISDQQAAEEVIKKIHDIGSVTLDSEELIAEARNAFNALTEKQKNLVDSEEQNVLSTAEALLEYLKAVDQSDKALEESQRAAEKALKDREQALKAAERALQEAERAALKAQRAAAQKAAEDTNRELEKLKFQTQKVSLKKAKSFKKKTFQVNWKKVSAADGYVIQYSVKSNFKNAKSVSVKKGNITSKTIKKVKSPKKYFVRIKAYRIMDGKKVYTNFSTKKSVLLK
ncbi:MAG: hypothetical protein UDG86_07390 [Lachnospiraceae bacterium]|jgi:Tfp pilus assembly protein PilX|nr:hypothetical protein [Lachnospiraceae bacterium]